MRKASAADRKFAESQRQILIDERATYLRQADSLKAEADSLAEQREPGDVQFDEESGEGDTLAVERERDLALSHQARAAGRGDRPRPAQDRAGHLRHLRGVGPAHPA